MEIGSIIKVKNMKHLPFSIIKKKDRRFFSVRFKNEQTGKYLPAISTKKESKQMQYKSHLIGSKMAFLKKMK